MFTLIISMDKELLKKVIVSQNKLFNFEFVKRDNYDLIKNNLSNQFIIVLSGIRRSGKSTILNQLRKENQENNYFLNFDDDRLSKFKLEHFEMLYESLYELYGEQNTFFFDEIQNIEGWERFVRRLHNEQKKVIITGSNAKLLSKELGTHLTGRNIEFKIYPFSFKEFLTFKEFEFKKNDEYNLKKTTQIKKLFEEYFLEGGIPEYLKTKNTDYLKTLYENILYKDILVRYNLSSEKTIKELVHFLISNLGKKISYNSLKKMLGVANPTTIKDYISYLENTFLLFQINKFDFSLKKQIINNKKIYCIDNALASTLSFKFSEEKGRLLENLIFLHFKRKNLEIYYHENKFECDFLIKEKDKITSAIQVCFNLNEDNEKREINGILEALTTHNLKEGIIITNDLEKKINVNNKTILIKPAWKFLIED